MLSVRQNVLLFLVGGSDGGAQGGKGSIFIFLCVFLCAGNVYIAAIVCIYIYIFISVCLCMYVWGGGGGRLRTTYPCMTLPSQLMKSMSSMGMPQW